MFFDPWLMQLGTPSLNGILVEDSGPFGFGIREL